MPYHEIFSVKDENSFKQLLKSMSTWFHNISSMKNSNELRLHVLIPVSWLAFKHVNEGPRYVIWSHSGKVVKVIGEFETLNW